MHLPQDIIKILKPQKIKSIAIYPLIVGNEMRGFLGCDECRYNRIWTAEELEILNTVSGIIANAYERKFFKEEIIDAEANFLNFFETMDDMLVISNLDGKVVYSNRSLIEKLGYSPLELENMNVLDLHPPERREESALIVNEMLKGKNKNCLLEVESKTGISYFIEPRVWSEKWNREDCIYNLSKDVTKENENINLFLKIFENNPLPMAITSVEEMKFIKINPMFSEVLGYSEEELLDKTVEELDIISDPEQLEKTKRKRLKYEEIKDEEIILRCKDGKLLSVIFSEEEINNQGAKSFLTVFVDVTERVELTKNVADKCQKLTNIIEGTDLGTWEWNVQTGKIVINEQWAKMIGYSLEELQPTSIETWTKFSHPKDLEEALENLEKHLKGELIHYNCQVRMKHKDGRWIWVHDRGKVIERASDGAPVKMFGTHMDITKEYEQSLELDRFFSINLDLLSITDIEGNFLKTNKAWEDILGYSSSKLQESNFFNFIHQDDISWTSEAIELLKTNKKISRFTNRYISADGKTHYIEWKSNLYENLLYSAARDITERIEYEKKILEISNKDSLTNIYNRRYVYTRGEEIIEEYKRTGKVFSVCIFDIDHFKKINDTYGHQAGDCVLKEFSRIIKESLRPYDILGRYGGEEFIIILNSIDAKASSLAMQRVLDLIRNKTFVFNENNIKITFSAGISDCKEIEREKNEIKIDNLVEIADRRMYLAKNMGRNKIIFKKT